MKSKDKFGNNLLHDLGCPATDGQHPVIAKQPLETYLSRHSTAAFSHGICPECAKKLYPDYVESSPDEPELKIEDLWYRSPW
jgi:hypothetical protein